MNDLEELKKLQAELSEIMESTTQVHRKIYTSFFGRLYKDDFKETVKNKLDWESKKFIELAGQIVKGNKPD